MTVPAEEDESVLNLNPMEDGLSLKDIAEGLDARIRWSQEIEGDLLTAALEPMDKTSKQLEQSPFSAVTSIGEYDVAKLYPAVPGFAPIDYKNYTDESRSCVEKFCDGLVKGKFNESSMKANRLYELMVFKYNLEKINRLKLKYAGYLLGEPFVNQETFQCPVRLFYDTESYKGNYRYNGSGIDFFIYLENVRGEWKIVQLTFMPKEKTENISEKK